MILLNIVGGKRRESKTELSRGGIAGLQQKQRCSWNAASYLLMKWPQGLAVITRPEHWELAAKHLWGLSRADLAAYLQSSRQEISHPTDDSRKVRSIEPQPQTPALRAKAASR
jgi:hypothetical protein